MNKELLSLLSEILDNSKELVSAEGGSIFLKEGDQLVLGASTGLEKGDHKILKTRDKAGEGITGWVFKHSTPVRIKDLDQLVKWKDKYDQVESRTISSMVLAPILYKNEVIGIIRCTNKMLEKGENNFTDQDIAILKAFAKTAAAAIAAQKELYFATNAPYLFVLMPFSAEFKDIYELGIKSVAQLLGIRCERVDEIEFNNVILEEIYKGIKSADIIVSDMTNRNPNVFYEVGYAHAMQKEVILLTQKTSDIPFDLKTHNHIVELLYFNGHQNKLLYKLLQ